MFQNSQTVELSGDYVYVKLADPQQSDEHKLTTIRAYICEHEVPSDDHRLTVKLRSELKRLGLKVLDTHAPVDIFVSSQDYHLNVEAISEKYLLAGGDDAVSTDAQKDWARYIAVVDGRFQIKLPWASDARAGNNLHLATRQFGSLCK